MNIESSTRRVFLTRHDLEIGINITITGVYRVHVVKYGIRHIWVVSLRVGTVIVSWTSVRVDYGTHAM